MADHVERDLTPLEYVVLGLISVIPQSGYSIVNYFEEGAYSWSASPGSIYPMLKRLEKYRIIAGEVEMEYETRPRKVYTLTPLGEQLLDAWLRETPKMRPFYQEREMALLRFQFMENRLSTDDILKWLDDYLDAVRYSDAATRAYTSGILQAMEEFGQVSLHRQLAMEAHFMELNTIRTWLEMARMRIIARLHQTREFTQINPTSEE